MSMDRSAAGAKGYTPAVAESRRIMKTCPQGGAHRWDSRDRDGRRVAFCVRCDRWYTDLAQEAATIRQGDGSHEIIRDEVIGLREAEDRATGAEALAAALDAWPVGVAIRRVEDGWAVNDPARDPALYPTLAAALAATGGDE